MRNYGRRKGGMKEELWEGKKRDKENYGWGKGGMKEE